MNFLSTFFLTLLPLVSIPLIIHLLNKRNVKTINFSSIRFLKALETESIKRLQFLQMFLMALRTLIILLIILMMSRPVVGGMFSLWDNDDSIITAIIIDDTFSNMGVENNTERLNLIKKAYLEVKTQVSDKSQIHVSTITDGVIFNGIKKDIPDIDKILDVSYDTGSLTSITLKINDEYKDDSAVKDLYLITDGQMQIFDDISVLDKILFNWNKFIIKLPEIKNNLSITNVNILNEIILPNIPIDIEVTITNNGTIDVKNHLLQLFINDINVGQQLISINKKTSSIFNFKTILTDTKFHECYAMLDKDDRIEDNNYYFTINIPETLKIGTINSSNSIYIANLFKSINYDNSTIITKNYSFDGISKAISDRNDILIINGYHIFDNYGPIALNYVGNGGHLILFPDNTDSLSTPLEIFDTLYQDKSIYHLSDDSYQTSKLVNNFNNFFISDSIYDSTIKLFKFFKVPQSSNSIVISKDSYSIFNRYFEGDGIVDIFTISPTLNWSNFPIKASFIPFSIK